MRRGTLVAAVLALAACDGGKADGGHISPPAGFGEPVGITLAGVPGLPPQVEIRVAVTAGRATDPLVKPIAQAVLKGLGACPAFVKVGQEGTVPSLAFRVEGGKVVSGTADDERARCVIDAMVGSSVGDQGMAPLDALAVVVFGGDSAAK